MSQAKSAKRSAEERRWALELLTVRTHWTAHSSNCLRPKDDGLRSEIILTAVDHVIFDLYGGSVIFHCLNPSVLDERADDPSDGNERGNLLSAGKTSD